MQARRAHQALEQPPRAPAPWRASPGCQVLAAPLQPGLRCAYCHAPAGEQGSRSCSGCDTRLHHGCWTEAGRCPTLGCAPATPEWRVLIRPDAVGPLPEPFLSRVGVALACVAGLCVATHFVLSAMLGPCCRSLTL